MSQPSNPLPSSQLSALREKTDKATQGPWWNESGVVHADCRGPSVHPARCDREEDAEFIAAFNPSVARALLDRLEALEQEVASLAGGLWWALDLMDMADDRLAKADGPDRVYTPVHLGGKAKARAALAAVSVPYNKDGTLAARQAGPEAK